MADKAGFPHYMLKEIFEQPQGLRDTIAPRVSLEEGVVRLDEVRISTDELRALRRINIVASGTSRHAGMAGQFLVVRHNHGGQLPIHDHSPRNASRGLR